MSYIEWLRARVGKQKIFLVFATVVLRDEQGRILLQRRTDFSFWGLPGGVMELNETVEMCARRELLEETGLTAGSLRLVGVYTDPKYEVTYPNGDQVQQFTVCFSGQVRGGVMQPDGQETTEQAFFAAEAMVTMNLPLWYADMVRDTLAEGLPTFAASRVTIDIADQIGTIRPFIGHDPLIAVGAAALAVRADGRLLAIQRQDNKMWALPAGYCDLGENVAHTAVRETLEETGLHIELERLLGVYSGSNFQHTHANGDQVQDVGVVFRARVIGGQLHPQVQEVAALQWLTPTTFLAKMGVKRRPFFANILALDG
ncbi:MAG: NUDIX domain-containing protein [Chloroflexi bacterium]|nr:NUDIX domain-containing protein [Chloroflexota bacterium]